MLDRARILELIPHQGTMCLLDSVVAWSATGIVCRAVSHLAADNPLRHAGILGGLAGVEYGLQAACLHGMLSSGAAGGRQAPGYLAALRDVRIWRDRLDDPGLGALTVRAAPALRQAAGMIYGFTVAGAAGTVLLEGRASIVLTPDVAR